MKLLSIFLSLLATTFLAEAATILPKFSDITNTVNVKLLSAQFTPFVNRGTNIVISPSNGNYQTWTPTNVSWVTMEPGNASFGQSIRLDVLASNTITWDLLLSNSVTLTVTNLARNVFLFDQQYGTNLWWGFRMP